MRELKNTVEYAGTVCPGELIHEDDLPRYFITALADAPVPKRSQYKAEESEKDAILKALDKVDWNKAKAARTLGIGRATLYNKLKRYGIKNRKTD